MRKKEVFKNMKPNLDFYEINRGLPCCLNPLGVFQMRKKEVFKNMKPYLDIYEINRGLPCSVEKIVCSGLELMAGHLFQVLVSVYVKKSLANLPLPPPWQKNVFKMPVKLGVKKAIKLKI